jgi:hypothetical protein
MVFSPAVNSRASPLAGRSALEAIFTKVGMRCVTFCTALVVKSVGISGPQRNFQALGNRGL